MPTSGWWYNDDINLYHFVNKFFLNDDDLDFVNKYLHNLHHPSAVYYDLQQHHDDVAAMPGGTMRDEPEHVADDDHLVYDYEHHHDHLIDHPYDDDYLYDPAHHFIVHKYDGGDDINDDKLDYLDPSTVHVVNLRATDIDNVRRLYDLNINAVHIDQHDDDAS